MKILLFGSTGMLGRYVFNILENIFDIDIIVINRDEFDISVDCWNKLEQIIIFNGKENDVIVNCAGIIPQKMDQCEIYKYIRINTLFPQKLDEICKKYNLKLIHISTDCVFSGAKGNYCEDDVHDTTNLYGITKSLGEPENSTVIRTSIIGEDFNNKKSLLEWIISNKNKTINGFTNHSWNGVTCLTLANIIKNIIQNNDYWIGVKHIYSPDVVSKYDLCNLVSIIYNLNINVIPLSNNISKNMTLNGKCQYKINNISDQIKEQKMFSLIYGNYSELKKCRFCDDEYLTVVIKFNDFPLVGSFIKNKREALYEKLYPLTLLYCDKCNTALIKEVIQNDTLFKKIYKNGYFYYSSTINVLVLHFNNLYNLVLNKYPSKKKITEIGCNDGVFLNNFINEDFTNIIGIDPSETINNIQSNKITKYNNYFNKNICDNIINKYGRQDIIVCCNCLAHIDNVYDIYNNIKNLLDDDGVIIIEVHYFYNIIKQMNFDFIYHEHMSYYTIDTFINICKKIDMYLENIEFIDIHGGSIRAYIKHKKNNDYYNDKLNIYIENEKNLNLQFIDFNTNLSLWKIKMLDLLDNAKNNNNLIVGYGASGRTNMILNYLFYNFDIIVDDSIYKINSFIPYYHNKIFDSNIIYERNIKIIFILSWPYTTSIVKKHIQFIKNGGIFYKILPSIEIIDITNYLSYL